MKQTIFIISFLLTLNIFGQNSDIENLINQIAKSEVPENFEYYFLVPKSIKQPKIYYSIQNYQIRELKMTDKSFETNLLYKEYNETTDWKNYELENVRYVPSEYNNPVSPPRSKNVRFVKYNIKPEMYDSLIENKAPFTLIVKKKWYWNKNRIWKNKRFYNELLNAWNKDKEINIEEKIFFRFSKPVFSKDKNYARIAIWKNRRCEGTGFTAVYRNENGNWKKLIEYNQLSYITTGTHSKCKEISIAYYE